MDKLLLVSLAPSLLCAACGDTSADRLAPGGPGNATRSVCADCPVLAGGESSDFGGTPHACIHFEQAVTIDRSQVDELGFHLAELEVLVERDVHATLRWRPLETPGGAAASGYRTQTWVEGAARLSGLYTYIQLDPARCSGNTCFSDEVGEWTCSDRLELGVEGQFRTLDGAVNTFASGYLLKGRDGFPFGEVPGSSLFAGLRDVQGSLELFPDPKLPIQVARLWIALRFKADITEGELGATITLEDGPGTSVRYAPLLASWPDTGPPADRESGIGGPEEP